MKKAPDCKTIIFSDHSVIRMFNRQISVADVKEVIREGEVLEVYANDQPSPSYLMHCKVGERVIHAVVGHEAEGSRCIVITVYEPDLSKFEQDFKTRKRK